jgi:hypothetical protein
VLRDIMGRIGELEIRVSGAANEPPEALHYNGRKQVGDVSRNPQRRRALAHIDPLFTVTTSMKVSRAVAH